ncbi:MAG: TonB-dependent receptor [Flavobacterium sp.]|nr:TonB-dependent receptor [Flavobacterium sp.]
MKTLKNTCTKQQNLIVAFLFLSIAAFSQTQISDSTKVNTLSEVMVSAIRSTVKTPMSYSNIVKSDFTPRNLGQDIPILLNFMPSVVTTSDAGNGVGYTGIRVRGSDATRVNVTINGIPYNDSESHGTFWVNMPDFGSSVESVQLQRGVGTSTNGAGAFGASLNLVTDNFSKESTGEISNSYGSFNTHKHTIKFSTGLLNNNFEMAGRVSSINSQGYIDRAASDLKSYFIQSTYIGKTTLIKGLIFGGKEKTYQSWYGLDAQTLANDRTFNYAGFYTDELGNTQFYDNQTDNYQQHHFQLHWNEKIDANWSSNLALHYTKGSGYYEEYVEDQSFFDYNLTAPQESAVTDLVRQQWLDNDFFGTTFSLAYKKNKTEILLGGSWNKYFGDHFGQVIWTKIPTPSELRNKYYENAATKTDGTVFLKVNYQLHQKWNLFADLQYRSVNYIADGVQSNLVDDVFAFLNPKAGVTFTLNKPNSFYFSYAKANREPNRTDYENGTPNSESLDDYELGWRHEKQKIKWNANIYFMNYKNQLVLTGELDDVGNPIRANASKSYRLGCEMELGIQITKMLSYQGNATLSKNAIAGESGTGDFQIAFSPAVISSNRLRFQPTKRIAVSWLQKYVGEQYLNNAESADAKLGSYATHDLNVSVELVPKRFFKSILFSGLVNNIFDKEYVSNGADYGGGAVYYYPQAGINFLTGITLVF